MAAWGTSRFAVRPGGRGAAAYPEGSMTHGGLRSPPNRAKPRASWRGRRPRQGSASPARPPCPMETRRVGSTSAGTRSSKADGTLSFVSDLGASCGPRQNHRAARSSVEPGRSPIFLARFWRRSPLKVHPVDVERGVPSAPDVVLRFRRDRLAQHASPGLIWQTAGSNCCLSSDER